MGRRQKIILSALLRESFVCETFSPAIDFKGSVPSPAGDITKIEQISRATDGLGQQMHPGPPEQLAF